MKQVSEMQTSGQFVIVFYDDGKICTGQIINGSVMPSSNTELQMINRHANSLLKELKERARIEFGIDCGEVTRAIRKYSGVI